MYPEPPFTTVLGLLTCSPYILSYASSNAHVLTFTHFIFKQRKVPVRIQSIHSRYELPEGGAGGLGGGDGGEGGGDGGGDGGIGGRGGEGGTVSSARHYVSH